MIYVVFMMIVFEDVFFVLRDYFVYYVFLNGVGEFILCFYLSVIVWVKFVLVFCLVIKWIWIFVVILVIVMSFLICVFYYWFF